MSGNCTDGKAKWISVSTRKPEEGQRVDLWFYIYASPRSMGMADAFKVESAWLKDGKWFHIHNGKDAELYSDYVTHWSPMPSPTKPPRAPKVNLW